MRNLVVKKQKQENKKYSTAWVKFEAVKLGGLWAYVVGTIEDKATGDRKVRIAKGKVKGKVHWEKGELVYTYVDSKDPISQISRLNIKNKVEWEKIKALVDKYIEELEKWRTLKGV